MPVLAAAVVLFVLIIVLLLYLILRDHSKGNPKPEDKKQP